MQHSRLGRAQLSPALWASLILLFPLSTPSRATPPPIEAPSDPVFGGNHLPRLRPPASTLNAGFAQQAALPGAMSALARPSFRVPPPLPAQPGPATQGLSTGDTARETASLRSDMAREVSGLLKLPAPILADAAARAAEMLTLTGQSIDAPQLVLVVDRNPSVERIMLMLARPGQPVRWQAIGAAHVSTGQAHRKDYYITPLGVFAHTDAILDFRAAGTRNEHHVRGLGLAGMRVWDFGWQWALKGWHTDNEGGDIRLQMHATDPALLERRLGRPASEGCVRLSSTMNRFLDRHGVLDADYERAAATDVRYSSLLPASRTPSPLAGRLLIVIDSGLPMDTPPTSASRPADWPSPDLVSVSAESQAGTQ